MSNEAREMCERVVQCGSYEEALNTLGEYVNITSVNENDEEACDEDINMMY